MGTCNDPRSWLLWLRLQEHGSADASSSCLWADRRGGAARSCGASGFAFWRTSTLLPSTAYIRSPSVCKHPFLPCPLSTHSCNTLLSTPGAYTYPQDLRGDLTSLLGAFAHLGKTTSVFRTTPETGLERTQVSSPQRPRRAFNAAVAPFQPQLPAPSSHWAEHSSWNTLCPNGPHEALITLP